MIFLFSRVYNPIDKKLEYLNPDLLEECLPEGMTLEQLDKIVGQNYDEYFDKEVYCGKTEARTLEPRNIKAVNIREMFIINK